MADFDYDSANERFLQLEKDLDLFDIRVDGVAVWERLRNQVSNQIVADLGFVSTPNELGAGSDGPGLQTCVRNSIIMNPFFATGQCDVFLYSHGRRKRLDDGYWWDIVIDPVAEELELPTLCVENYGDSAHATPAKTERLKYKDVISCATGLGKRLSGVWNPLTDRGRRRIEDVEREIEDVFGTNLDLVAEVEQELIARRIRLTLYRTLLSRLDPEVVVVWTRPHTLVEAAQSLDIPVVELQHGMIYRYNFDYHFPNDQDAPTFADYLFTFGEYWCNAVDYPISQTHIIPTGYAYTEMVLEQYRDSTTRTDDIVFLSQPYVGEKLSRFAVEFASLVDDRQVTYKLHPREYNDWKQRYPWLASGDLRVVDTEEPELYELLANADTQVGVSSTALYEGTLFDTTTYLVNLPRVSTMEYFLQSNVPVVDSPRDLLASINNGTKVIPDSEPLFAPDPIKTTVQKLRSVATDKSL